MNAKLLREESIFNIYIRKETWEDIRLYRDEYKFVISGREEQRITFLHRSPQIHYRHQIIDYLKSFAIEKQLTHCTLHLGVYLLDLFMDNHAITSDRILLVANVCLLLAGKLEENNLTIPKLNDLNAAVKNVFPIQNYKSFEIIILQFFQWYIMFPTAAHYIHYYLQAALCREDFLCKTNTTRSLLKGMHLVIRDYLDKIIDDVHYMQCFKPSKLAAAIISIARLRVGLCSWTEQLHMLTSYTEYDIEETRLGLLKSIPLECKNCINITY